MSRDELYERFREQGIYTRKYFYPLTSDQACFRNKYMEDEIQIARRLAELVLVLPLYEELGLQRVEKLWRILDVKK